MSEVGTTTIGNNTALYTGVSTPHSGEVSTQSTSSTATTGGVRVDVGQFYLQLSVLSDLGLVNPTAPKDLQAYFAALLMEVEEIVAKFEEQKLRTENETLLSLLAMYQALFSARPTLEARLEENQTKINERNNKLSDFEDQRKDLVKDWEKLESKIEKEDSASKKAELVAKQNDLNIEILELDRDMDVLQEEVIALTAIIQDDTETLSQLDTAFIVLLTAIVRERTPVDNESSNGDLSRVERSEDKQGEMRNHAIELNLSQVRQQEFLDAIRGLAVKFDLDRDLSFRVALNALQLILKELPVQENGGILPDLSGHEKDGGGRLRLSV